MRSVREHADRAADGDVWPVHVRGGRDGRGQLVTRERKYVDDRVPVRCTTCRECFLSFPHPDALTGRDEYRLRNLKATIEEAGGTVVNDQIYCSVACHHADQVARALDGNGRGEIQPPFTTFPGDWESNDDF